MFKQLTIVLGALFGVSMLVSVGHASADIAPEAMTDDADPSGYDSIVNELNREQAATVHARSSAKQTESPFDAVWMHGGVGFANFIESIHFNDGKSATLNQRGIQAALGIDLLSPNWMAEGTARGFAEDGDVKLRSSVQEFELKVLYKDRLSSRLGYRAGLGLSARYLSIKRQGFNDANETTPTSVGTIGADIFVNERFSVGADLNARNALIGETIDHNSADMTLRMDAHF